MPTEEQLLLLFHRQRSTGFSGEVSVPLLELRDFGKLAKLPQTTSFTPGSCALFVAPRSDSQNVEVIAE